MKNLYRRTVVAALLSLAAGSVLAATSGLSPSIFPTPGQNAATWPKVNDAPVGVPNVGTVPKAAETSSRARTPEYAEHERREHAERERYQHAEQLRRERTQHEHFEGRKAVELQALDARADILRSERSCVQGIVRKEQMHDCREQAKARREAMAKELKAKYAKVLGQAKH